MIYVFGHTGLLGRYVFKYLTEQGKVIKGISSKEMDLRYEIPDLNSDDIVVNCAGLVPNKIKNTKDAILLNAVMPHKINEICRLIHISTDCVFKGDKSPNEFYYDVDIKDDTSIYGKTKGLGECGMTIRTSFVGEGGGLLQWILDSKEKNIHGYYNYQWNGVTCLQVASFICDCLKNYSEGIYHLSSNKSTKYSLLHNIDFFYNLKKNIIQVNLPTNINRCLDNTAFHINSSLYDFFINIKEQCGYL